GRGDGAVSADAGAVVSSVETTPPRTPAVAIPVLRTVRRSIGDVIAVLLRCCVALCERRRGPRVRRVTCTARLLEAVAPYQDKQRSVSGRDPSADSWCREHHQCARPELVSIAATFGGHHGASVTEL